MRVSRATRTALDTVLKAQEQHSNLNAFITRVQQTATPSAFSPDGSGGPLQGQQVAVKDNIATADLPTTCASKALQTYTSPFDATVVTRIKQAGGHIVGKTNLDEFGMGSHSLNSAFGSVKSLSQDAAPDLSAGGSSGGSAVAVATGQCDVAVGTDTGGSVRLPAAYTGVYGFKPSYGLVSRWGVVAYANSLDTVGFLARDVSSLRSIFHACNIHDPKDPTSLLPSTRARLTPYKTIPTSLRIGVPREYNISSLTPQVRTAWQAALLALKQQGHTLHAISLPSTPAALSAYYVLAPAEASSNLAKYDSVRYGTRPPPKAAPAPADPDASEHTQSGIGGDLFAHARAHGLGPEVRRRILLGSYTLSAAAKDSYFVQAQRVRRRVVREFDAVFACPNALSEDARGAHGGIDLIVVPTAPTVPPTLDEVRGMTAAEAYAGDVFTVPASLAGLPAISVPVRTEIGEQIGMQVMGQFGSDDLVLGFAEAVRDKMRAEQ